ncbi:hypothetical protein AYK26_07150 [Euryarchaeota archaeon SM23-78]|nr:MAG: hypothetical protein AYK26_07150 [Euryarchaeota archaeon SM23-78]
MTQTPTQSLFLQQIKLVHKAPNPKQINKPYANKSSQEQKFYEKAKFLTRITQQIMRSRKNSENVQ